MPEGYAIGIKPGMPAQVFVQERAGKPINGTVTRTAGSIDQNTRTMLTEVDVDNRDGSLFPGMYAVVTFVQVRGRPPLTVPGDAVVVRQDRNTVAVVRDEKIQMVPVEIGRDYGPSVEILSGLQKGDLGCHDGDRCCAAGGEGASGAEPASRRRIRGKEAPEQPGS